MPFYTGSSPDGSDMKEIDGIAYVNPHNPDEWSTKPYPGQQSIINLKNAVLDYMDGRYTLNDVYEQIKNKQCPLSRRERDFVLAHYDKDGNFINREETEN